MMDRRLGAAALVLATLSACQDGTGGSPFGRLMKGPDASAKAASAAAPGSVEEVDVEAPDAFSLTAQGLWDGRPSLGGVWVAHPDVTSPERVVIRTAGGRSVTGALFTRTRESAGPPFQISSEAATALGLPPGTAAELSVVALRKEARVTPPAPIAEPGAIAASEPPAAQTTGGTAALASAATVTAAPLDPAIGAAVAAAETAPTPAAAAAPARSAPRPPADATVVAPGAADAPFVQVGFFAEEEGAEAAVTRLEAAGVEARIAVADSGARRLWRVVAGPAETVAARDDLIAAIRAAGYDRPAAVAN